MNVLKRMTWKNLKLNRKRTLVTIVGIILSSALISAVFSMAVCFRGSLITYYKAKNGDFHYTFTDVLAEDMTYFANNRKVENYYYTRDIGCAALPESANEDKSYLYVTAATDQAMKGLHLRLLSGRFPEREDEIVVPRHLRMDARVVYKIGDTVTFSLGDRVDEGEVLSHNDTYNGGTIENAVEKTYKVVGEIERPSYYVEEYLAAEYTLLTYMPTAPVNGQKYNVYARYTPEGIKEHYTVTAGILGVDSEFFNLTKGGVVPAGKWDTEDSLTKETKKERYFWNSNDQLRKLESWDVSNDYFQMIFSLVVVSAVIILVVSVFCIRNTFEISITEKVRQYGMLASIGATRKQIRRNVYQEAAILGMIGIPIGVFVGMGASVLLTQIADRLLSEAFALHFSYHFSVFPLLTAVLFGVVTIFFSARHSAKRASKISPIMAIRETRDIYISKRKIRSPKWIRKLFGIGGVISYKNMRRNRKKYRTTVVSIVVCVIAFISLSSVVQMAYQSIEMDFGVKEYELQVSISDTQLKTKNGNKSYEEAVKNISALEGIDAYSSVRGLLFSITQPPYTSDAVKYMEASGEMEEEEEICPILIALGKEEYRRYLKELKLSYENAEGKAILVNGQRTWYFDQKSQKTVRAEFDIYSYKEGDLVHGAFFGATAKEKVKWEFTLAAVTDQRPLGTGEEYRSGGYIVVSDDEMNRILKNPVLFEQADWREIYIQTSAADSVQEKLYTVLDEFRYDIRNYDKEKRERMALLYLVEIFLYGFIIVVALIGITSIFNTITTNMELRSKEFAMLRSVGMTNREFKRMVGMESLFYSVKALAIGIPVGIIISGFIYGKMMSGGYHFQYAVPFSSIVISIIGVFVLLLVITRYSLKRIDRRGVIDVIRNENI